jgi:RHS repeat-associated protein
MGARHFSPDTGRFLQDDMYEDALGDLGLSADPLTSNRYALAGGNPVSFVEFDGHYADANGDGQSDNTGSVAPGGQRVGRTSRVDPTAPPTSSGVVPITDTVSSAYAERARVPRAGHAAPAAVGVLPRHEHVRAPLRQRAGDAAAQVERKRA